MQTQLATLVLAIWAAIHPAAPKLGSANAIANAIAVLAMEDAGKAPIYGSHDEDIAIMAVYAWRESSLNAHAVGDGGQALGVWQLHSTCGRASVLQQARCWKSMLREGARICPASPSAPLSGGCKQARKVADRRLRETRAMLRVALAKLSPPEPPVDGVAERQSTAVLDSLAQ